MKAQPAKIATALLLAALLLSPRGVGFVSIVGEGSAEEYRLPWASGQRMYTLQGQEQGTHQGIYSKYAYDFAPGPVNDAPFEVLAARSGVVTLAVDTFSPGQDCDPTSSLRSNFVLVDHGDGTGAKYEHLEHGSASVKVGQHVTQGTVLAKSGKTGYVCGIAHLHYTAINTTTRESIDQPFSDPDLKRHNGRPKSGEWYRSSNLRVSPKAGKSFFPIVLWSHKIPSAREASGTRPP